MKILRKDFSFALVCNAVFLMVALLVMRPIFETNDDLTIMEMVSGAWNLQNAHIVYQNYLLGKLYVCLYLLTKHIPW